MASKQSLKAQQRWMEEREKLGKLHRKLAKAAAKPDADTAKLQRKLAKAAARLAEMEAEEAAVAAASVAATPPAAKRTFSLAKTPTSGIAKTAFGAEEAARRTDREARFAAEALAGKAAPGESVTLQELRLTMAARSGGTGAPEPEDDDAQWAPAEALFGTSTALEKPYLRLTAAPPRHTIRPPKVLKRALRHAKGKWAAAVQGGGELKAPYSAFCEQMKSIRQDLTVQHIRTELTVAVYETHARVALEVCDMAELTQCAGCLRRLYAEGLLGQEAEFAAYGLLMAAGLGTQAVALELLSLARRDTELAAADQPALSAHPFVRHAAEVAEAVRCANLHRFLSLYGEAPRMSAYLMDAMLGRMRAAGLAALLAAYRAPLPLAFVAESLGFESPDAAAEYVSAAGVVVDRAARAVDPVASRAAPAGPPRPP
eukprot:jgi/Tetstr1/443487/TSEL_031495.t1